MLKFWIVFVMVFILSCQLQGIISSESDCKPFNETDILSVTNEKCQKLDIDNADICYTSYKNDHWRATITCRKGFYLANFNKHDPATCYKPINKDNYRWIDADKCCVPEGTEPICLIKKSMKLSSSKVMDISTTTAPSTATIAAAAAKTASTNISGCVPLCIGMIVSLMVLTILGICLYKKIRGSHKALNVQGQESPVGRVSFGYINPVHGETDLRGSYINSIREQKVSSISANCYDYADNVDAGDQYMYAEMV